MKRKLFAAMLVSFCCLLFANLANAQKARTITGTIGQNARQQIVEKMFTDGLVDRTAVDMNNQLLTVEKLSKEIKFRAVDLNGDGVEEVVVEASNSMGLCGSSGCVSFIYERKGNTWKQLIQEPTNGTLSVARTKTHGFLDLSLATQSGAYDQFFHFIKFDGNKYRENSCIEHNYIDPKGNIMKHPRISKC